jgi:hypothetical protein
MNAQQAEGDQDDKQVPGPEQVPGAEQAPAFLDPASAQKSVEPGEFVEQQIHNLVQDSDSISVMSSASGFRVKVACEVCQQTMWQ